MGDTASGDPDKMADYQDEGSEQTSLWGDEVTNLQTVLTYLRNGMNGMPGTDSHLSLMIPDYATVLSETKTAQVSLDNWVKDVGEALREAGTKDPDTGLYTANESSMDVPPPEMPSVGDPAQAAADVRELLWDSEWLFDKSGQGWSDYDLDEEEFQALMAEISVYMEDPEYAAEFYGEMGVDGVRAMNLAFFATLNGPATIANPGESVHISEADQIEDIQVLLSDPLYMSFVDGFARATTTDNYKMAELEAALLEMEPTPESDDPLHDGYSLDSPRMLLGGYRTHSETAELQLSLLLSADPELYDDGFLERAADALGVEPGDLETHLEERLGSAPGTSLDHPVTLVDHDPDAPDQDQDDPPSGGWEAESRDDGTGYTPSDEADSPDVWTVGNNDSFWAVSEELLVAQGVLDPADKGSPEYERTVWEFHVQLIELNTDTDGVINDDLIYEGAALVLPDPTDLDISADTGSGEETPTEETSTEETDPVDGSDAEFTGTNQQYDEPIGPGLGDDSETVSHQGSGGWDEFGLDDPDVVATVLADPEGYNLDSDYVAAAAETLFAESDPGHDYEDRRRQFVAVRALAQDPDASIQFVNASDENRERLEGDIPNGGAASSEYEGMTLNEVWRDAADQVLNNADPTSDRGSLVVDA